MAAHSEKADRKRLLEEMAPRSDRLLADLSQTGPSVPRSWRVISADDSASGGDLEAQSETPRDDSVLKPYHAATAQSDRSRVDPSPNQNVEFVPSGLVEANAKGLRLAISPSATARNWPSSAKPKIEMPIAEPDLQLSKGDQLGGQAARHLTPRRRAETSGLKGGMVLALKTGLPMTEATVPAEAGPVGPETAAFRRPDPLVLKPITFDAELSRVIHVWSTLPPRLRHAILAVVDAAASG